MPLMLGIMLGMHCMLLLVAYGVGSLITLYPALHFTLKVAGRLPLFAVAFLENRDRRL